MSLIENIAPTDRIVRAQVRAIFDSACAPAYGIAFYVQTTFDAAIDYQWFETRDERQAAILALCDRSEREGFALTIR